MSEQNTKIIDGVLVLSEFEVDTIPTPPADKIYIFAEDDAGETKIKTKNSAGEEASIGASTFSELGGQLEPNQLPDEIDARVSVLTGTDAALSETALSLGELAAPTDKNYLRRGDGVNDGGRLMAGALVFQDKVVMTDLSGSDGQVISLTDNIILEQGIYKVTAKLFFQTNGLQEYIFYLSEDSSTISMNYLEKIVLTYFDFGGSGLAMELVDDLSLTAEVTNGANCVAEGLLKINSTTTLSLNFSYFNAGTIASLISSINIIAVA